MRSATVLRLAIAGSRVDRVRMTLTAFGALLATLALLSAATVAAVGPGDGPYTSELLNQSGLHPGVVVALLGLCVPVLVLLAQCSRIGAPARDRRLAAMRLGGATPGEVARVTTAEAAAGSGLGALLGLGVFFLLRALFSTPVHGNFSRSELVSDANGVYQTDVPVPSALRVPTDVLPPWWAMAVIVVLVPVLVSGATLLALRRVAFTPFGVSRRVRTQPPRVVPLVLIVVGVGMFFLAAGLAESVASLPSSVLIALLLGGFLVASVGLLGGQGAITQAVGRLLVRRTSRPALLLAGRRMIADPFNAARATSVLSVTVLMAAGARHLRNVTVADQHGSGDVFYTNAYDLVDLVLVIGAVLAALGLLVATAEGIVARRRTYSAVVAAGTPRRVVARAVLAEMLLPLIPSLFLATIVGTAAAVGFFGRTVAGYEVVDAAGRVSSTATVTVGLSWLTLILTLLLAFAITALTTSAGLLFLRSATDVGELRAAA
ncbi:FtsX-like permease family protein [Jatrophihabitans sp. YIM 134969]